ncbi:MAG TPA: cyclic nucleotide-binding domain-containing protein [Pseudonocardiaceae bacterium]|nr:cyclic nucleotide-binding domain-containing protein [Pseudonocardiaceae bacterium]
MDADTAGDEEALFTALDGPTQAELRARGRQQTYRPGSVLFYEGQLEAPVVIAVSGHLRVSAFSSDGRELILAFRGRGAILGELAALDRGRRSATVSAVDVVRAVIVQPPEFEAFLRDTREAARALLRLVVHRLRDADRKRIEFATGHPGSSRHASWGSPTGSTNSNPRAR